MNEIICDKCAATFTPDMIEIQNRVITQDEEHNDIIEQYYECPICGTHYTITITDRVQRIAIQKRRQLQTAVKNAIRARRPARAQTYKNKEKELADDIQAQVLPWAMQRTKSRLRLILCANRLRMTEYIITVLKTN